MSRFHRLRRQVFQNILKIDLTAPYRHGDFPFDTQDMSEQCGFIDLAADNDFIILDKSILVDRRDTMISSVQRVPFIPIPVGGAYRPQTASVKHAAGKGVHKIIFKRIEAIG